MKAINSFATLLTAAFLVLGASAADPSDAKNDPLEKETCSKNLRQIYDAIQAYRKDHKELPHWLSDLTPAYLKDSAALKCPVSKRTGQGIPYKFLADPKIETSYIYEFCDAPMGQIWGGGQLKMREFKSMQMGVIGGVTPMIRCLLHGGVLEQGLNMSLMGRFGKAN
jgi:hypothetical protein